MENAVSQLLCNGVRNFRLTVCVCLSVRHHSPVQIGKPTNRYDICNTYMPKYGVKPTHSYVHQHAQHMQRLILLVVRVCLKDHLATFLLHLHIIGPH